MILLESKVRQKRKKNSMKAHIRFLNVSSNFKLNFFSTLNAANLAQLLFPAIFTSLQNIPGHPCAYLLSKFRRKFYKQSRYPHWATAFGRHHRLAI